MMGGLSGIMLLVMSGIFSSANCQNAGALFDSIGQSDIPTIRQYLVAGGDPNCRSSDGDVPLVAAVKSKNVNILDLLLSYNANPNLTDAGASPLYYAVLFDCEECAKILLKKDARVIADAGQIEYLKKFEFFRVSKFWHEILAIK
ncbi:hypothetical protein CO666_32650 [Rhizobium chutanense]|uniref:Uncharacterized protein n=1 Tax=Rhizobium chutanense TaxID=2035448 RepID=A0A2A6J1X7_9HYPH|nr:ankyrin repeat domain-containing protein [Rhizobium chutanense]PDT00055.1 hypothetical protein CO666_32650 [Rhizobium chutanense]